MPRLSSALPWILLFLAVVALGGAVANEVFDGKQQREFDYFALSLQWAGTFCRGTKYCCSKNACCRGADTPRIFTIHGLWPDYNDGTWPSCCSDTNFNPKEIAPLTDALEKYWPTMSCSSPSTCHGGKGSFWQHEWEKHGTCAAPVTGDEYNYFLTTLNIYFKYNITKVLNDAGYVPSNTEKYPLGGIVSAIQNAYHVSPELMCKKDAVQEVRICFYKDFQPRDCVIASNNKIDMVTKKGSCPRYVSLPDIEPLGHDELQSWESESEDDAAL